MTLYEELTKLGFKAETAINEKSNIFEFCDYLKQFEKQ